MARQIILAALEGSLAGFFAGAALGVWQAHLHGDAGYRMWFLLAWRIDYFVFAVLLGGAGLSVTLAMFARALASATSAGLARLATLLAPIFGLSGLLVLDSVRRWSLMVLRPPGSPEFVGWISAAPLALATLAIVLVRMRDAGEAGPRRADSMSRLRTQSAAAGVLLAVLAFAVHFTLPFVAARRAAGHPSVVLISIDTLRADRLGVAGYSRNLTPALDRLADQGAAFLQATSTAPWTFPAHLSLFTSTLPFDSGTRIWRAAPDFLMLAEIFKNAGYRTQAHTGGTWIHARIGFSQGFESFTSHNEIKKGGPASYLAEAAEWIGDGGRVPFFLLLHTYEPHIPYVHGDYADPTAAGLVGETFDVDDLESLRSGKFVPNEVERAYIIDLYDGDVAASDRYVGAFLDRLDQMCAPEDVVVMVLSDHGEDLWDHVPERSADHGHSLYEELLRVPWIVRKAGDVTPGLRIQQPVSLVDVAPTLLELADLPLSPGHTGRSLAKNLLEGTEPPVRSVFAEMVEYGPDRFSVRHHDLKVILTPFPGIVRDDLHLAVDTLEVFDLAQDPLEQSNLGLHDLEATGPLAKMLEQRAALGLGEGGTRPDSDPIPEKLLEEIRALGYTR